MGIRRTKFVAKLIDMALKWQKVYGNTLNITGSLAEYDAAMAIGCSEAEYQHQMRERSAVRPDFDFIFSKKRYQVKSARPSGRKNDKITFVRKPKNCEWDFYLWVRYNCDYSINEIRRWNPSEFKKEWGQVKRLSPNKIQFGKKLFPKNKNKNAIQQPAIAKGDLI